MSKPAGHLIERAARRLGGLARIAETEPLGQGGTVSPGAASVQPIGNFVSHDMLAAAGMMPWGRRRDLLTEEFRVGQAGLLRVIDRSESGRLGQNLLLVTSARAGEGKSFVALNLAASLAHYAERSVLLIDVDPKDRSMTHQLGLSDQPGLLDVAKGTATLPQAVCASAVSRLSVLPLGAGADRAAASAEQPLVRAVERVAQARDDAIILLDLPPCLSRSEASQLAPLAGHVLMVVEAQRTQRAELESALDLVEACPSILLLLNKMRPAGRDAFGRYGEYS